jgi:hypothetical protein
MLLASGAAHTISPFHVEMSARIVDTLVRHLFDPNRAVVGAIGVSDDNGSP